MDEGPISEPNYYFPGKDLSDYLSSLDDTDLIEDEQLSYNREKILIMTHDDIFDFEMYEFEKDNNLTSTWFIDVSEGNIEFDDGAVDDIEIHFNKEKSAFKHQITRFTSIFGREPIVNRNHRLLMRSKNFDFPFLSMNGILIDSTEIGTRMYFPVIFGKKLPLLELQFCISDFPTRPMCLYNIARNIELPFRSNLNPIVVNAHPYSVCKKSNMVSCYDKVLKLAMEYDYQVMSIMDFMACILKDVEINICEI
jgi:hypothetical protein